MAKIPMIQTQNAPGGFVRAGNAGQGVDMGGLVRGLGSLAADQRQLEQQAQRKADAEAERQRREAEAAYQKQQQDEATIAVLKATSDARMRFTERLDAAKDGDATGFTSGMLKEFDGWQQETAKTVPEMGRKLFEQQAIQLRTQLHGQAFSFETGARQKKLASDFDASLDGAARAAWSDPSSVTDLLARHIATARSLGVPDDLKVKMTEMARDRIAYSAASGLVERDPNGVLQRMGFAPGKWQPGQPLPDTGKAAEAVKNDPIFSNLPPEKLQGVLHRALALSAAQDASAQRMQDKATKDAEDAVKDLREFALTGALASPAYRDEVLAKTRGTPFAAQAQELLALSVSAGGFGAQSLPRQEQAIRALEASQAQSGASPEELKMAAHVRQINAAQRKAYEDNPWAAATRFARLPAEPEMQIPSAEAGAQLVAQRAAKAGAVEAAAGRPVSPLQPAEAAAWSDHLSKLPVPQRAEALGSAGVALKAPQINELAEQIGKGNRVAGLMLKAGADRTTAGRTLAELIGRGEEALRDKRVAKDDAVASGWRAEITGIVRGALGDAKAEQDAIDMAYFVRAAMEDSGAAAPGFKMGKSNRDAVSLVLGDVIERDGVKTVLPKGMDEDAFTAKVRTLYPARALRLMATPEPGSQVQAGADYSNEGAGRAKMVNSLFVRGQEVNIDSLAQTLPGLPMRRTGSGQYIPVSGGAFITLDRAGTKPLVLDVVR